MPAPLQVGEEPGAMLALQHVLHRCMPVWYPGVQVSVGKRLPVLLAETCLIHLPTLLLPEDAKPTCSRPVAAAQSPPHEADDDDRLTLTVECQQGRKRMRMTRLDPFSKLFEAFSRLAREEVRQGLMWTCSCECWAAGDKLDMLKEGERCEVCAQERGGQLQASTFARRLMAPPPAIFNRDGSMLTDCALCLTVKLFWRLSRPATLIWTGMK